VRKFCVVDTSVLVGTVDLRQPRSAIAIRAIDRLVLQGCQLYIVPQSLYEFWVVATRPLASNGLGLSFEAALRALHELKQEFLLLGDRDSELYAEWERLVTEYRVMGKPAHDARIAAAMVTHGVRSILTFDPAGFARFAEVDVLDPAGV
jgi:predicted nucleic acid-binding protein